MSAPTAHRVDPSAPVHAEPPVAQNYAPLPLTIAPAEGAWATDVERKRYLDLLAAYSALNFGHRHPSLLGAAAEQLGQVTLASRAFMNNPPRAVRRGARPALRQGPGAADEHRRRGRRDRHQGGARHRRAISGGCASSAMSATCC